MSRLGDIKNILKYKNVKICLLGSFVSTAGDCFNDIAILSFVFIIYGSVDRISWIYTAVYIAMFLASPLIGVINDKFEKRKMLIISSMVQGFLVLMIIAFSHFGVILFCLFLETILSVLVKLSIRSTIKESVTEDELVMTTSLSTGMIQVTRVLSPAIAGFLMAFWKEDIFFATRFVLGIDAFSFLISSIFFLFLSKGKGIYPRDKVKSHFITDVKFGWNALVDHRYISIFYIYGLLLTIAGTIPFLIKIPYIMSVLQGGTKTLGLANSFAAAGAIGGAFMATIFLKSAMTRTFIFFRFCEGILYIFLGIFSNISLFYILFMSLNVARNIAKISEESFQQVSIEKEVFGRVSSWYISANAIIVLIMLRIGVFLTNLMHIQTLYILAGIWYILVSAIFLKVMRKNVLSGTVP